MQAGGWNGRLLLREVTAHGYAGGYTIFTAWLRPQRAWVPMVAVRRLETPPGVTRLHCEHLRMLKMTGQRRTLWGFAFSLGYSRVVMTAAMDQ